MKIKASSLDMQIIMPLTKDQAIDLGKQGKLEGILTFNDKRLDREKGRTSSERITKEIPFILELDKTYERSIEIYTNPVDVYLEKAEDFVIRIYQPHYKRVLREKSFTAKFFDSGLLTIYRKD